MRRWYVVNTRVRSEEKARFHLARQGFEPYLPRYLKRRSHARKVEWLPAPMFPRYVFVMLDPELDQWRPIRSTFGVSQFVCVGEKPAPVPVGVIEDIRARENDKGLVSLGAVQKFKRGQKVMVVHGAMVEQVGIFECIDDQERVSILLEMLGRQVSVRLPLEAIAAHG